MIGYDKSCDMLYMMSMQLNSKWPGPQCMFSPKIREISWADQFRHKNCNQLWNKTEQIWIGESADRSAKRNDQCTSPASTHVTMTTHQSAMIFLHTKPWWSNSFQLVQFVLKLLLSDKISQQSHMLHYHVLNTHTLAYILLWTLQAHLQKKKKIISNYCFLYGHNKEHSFSTCKYMYLLYKCYCNI